MSDPSSIPVRLSRELLSEIELLASTRNMDVSELIGRAVRMYVTGERRREVREVLRRGYQEMADLNLTLAQESLLPDTHAWGEAPDGGG